MIRFAVRSIVLLFALTTATMAGELEIRDPWIRTGPPGARFVAGYFNLVNHGNRERRLLSVSSPQAAGVALHRSMVRDGMVRMESVDAVTIGAGGNFKLEPGAYHLMIGVPATEIQPGEKLTLLLQFDEGEEIRVDAVARAADYLSSDE